MTTILLTATIHTNGCSWLKRSNPKDREKDYFDSLQKWLKNTDFDFVFCENSNADLSFLQPLIKEYKNRIELLSFDDNFYDRNLGKGFGEVKTINYALLNSNKLKNEKILNKVSGRYYLSNIKNVLDAVSKQQKEIKLIVYYHPPMDEYAVIPTVYFGVEKELYFNIMSKECELINDSIGRYIEHALYSTYRKTNIDNVVFF